MAEIENLKIGNGGTLHIVGNEDIVANAWQAGKTYVKNKSYVIREHRLYVCNVTHTSVEPFDATKWTEITVGEAIAANTTAIGDLSSLTTTDKSSLVGAVNEVDTELSNKADKALTGFNLTAGTGMSLQYVNCFAFGNLKVISANVIVGSGATTTIATVPSAYSALNYTFFYLGKNGGNGAYGYIAGTTLRTDSVLSTGNYTINFVYR